MKHICSLSIKTYSLYITTCKKDQGKTKPVERLIKALYDSLCSFRDNMHKHHKNNHFDVGTD